jgi:hemerythrin
MGSGEEVFVGKAAGGGKSAALLAIEREHRLQIALVDAFETAVAARERVEAGRILEQMAALSKMHFLAEELVMQLHQYPAYEEHAREHAMLMEEMHLLLAQHAAGSLEITLDLAERLRRTLANHLGGSDHALASYMRAAGIVETGPEAPPS